MKALAIKFGIMTLLIFMSYLLPAAQSPDRKFNQEQLEKERKENNYDLTQPEEKEKEQEEKRGSNKDTKPDSRESSSDSGSYEAPSLAINFPPWLVYTIAFILLAVLLAFLLNMSAGLPFSRGERKPQEEGEEETEVHENIHDINFNKDIQNAIDNGDYRKAIRLYYLLSLKLLSDKKLIDWQSHKTNREYIRELRTPDLKYKLEEVTYMFELIWYGEVEMNKSVFEEILTEVRELHQRIKAIK